MVVAGATTADRRAASAAPGRANAAADRCFPLPKHEGRPARVGLCRSGDVLSASGQPMAMS
jgi:hypothetical protein